MSAAPYMKLYVADYLGDTHHLGALEHGAYLLLLMGMWRAGGTLPAADANLARLARCTPDEWSSIKGAILPFFRASRGKLTHKRLTAELAKYENTSGKRSEAGKRGAAKKAIKNSAEAQAIASGADSNCRHNQNQNQNHKEDVAVVGASERVEQSTDWPERPDEELIRLIASPWLDPNKSHGLVTTAGRVSAWRRDGASWERDVVPVVRGLCANRHSPVATWKFFDSQIAQAVADNRRTLEIPEARPAPVQFVTFADRRAAENEEARRLAFARMDELAHG